MNEKAKGLLVEYYTRRQDIEKNSNMYGFLVAKKMIANIDARIAQIKNLDNSLENYNGLIEVIEKKSVEINAEESLNRTLDLRFANMQMKNIQELSKVLGCQDINDFRVSKTGIDKFFGGNVDKFNYENKDIEMILRSTFNAQFANQYVMTNKMMKGEPYNFINGQIVPLLSERLNVKGPRFKMSYSEFNAKFTAIDLLLKAEKDNKILLNKENKLYLYNQIVNLMAMVKDNKVNSNDIDFYDDMDILETIDNDNLQNFYDKTATKDLVELNDIIKENFDSMNDVRQQIEVEIDGKAIEKFNPKKCNALFRKAIEVKDEKVCQ